MRAIGNLNSAKITVFASDVPGKGNPVVIDFVVDTNTEVDSTALIKIGRTDIPDFVTDTSINMDVCPAGILNGEDLVPVPIGIEAF